MSNIFPYIYSFPYQPQQAPYKYKYLLFIHDNSVGIFMRLYSYQICGIFISFLSIRKIINKTFNQIHLNITIIISIVLLLLLLLAAASSNYKNIYGC